MKPANRMLPLYKFLYKQNIQNLYYVEEDPTKLVGLSLNFYLKKDLETFSLGEQEVSGKTIFTKRYAATSMFLSKQNCENIYLNYPQFLLSHEVTKKLLKSSKVMGIFKCQ